MKRLSLAIMLALMSISAMLAQRTVSGTVTDTKGEPLIGVSIFARGTSVGTVTDIDGTYSLNVPEGVNTLVFSYTGFETKEVSLGASNVIDVQMEEAVEQLSEVVVTGLGIRKEKKALGYGVTTLDQSALELRPEADVARVLRGKVPGVDITSTSGLAGSGTNVIIRGYSSITGTNQPLFVVDGVPFNSDTRADQGVLAGAASASSRFLDLDPNNIAEVSVLKGLSATVLYGEAGRNGVILITTKNGASRDLNKKFEVTVDQSFFANDIASLPDDQDAYGNGFWNTASAAFSNWGAPFDQPGKYGVAEDGTIRHPYDRAALNAVFPQYVGARYPYKAYDNLQNFFQTGLISNTSVNIANRLSEGTSINFNYGYRNEEGFVPLSKYKKNTFGLGINTRLSNQIGVRTTLNFVRSDRVAPPTGTSTSSNPNDGASLFSNVFYTPRSVDLNGLEWENPLDHSSIYYRGGNDIQHPYWTLHNTKNSELVNRFFGTLTFDYSLTDWLTLTYRYGLDTYAQRNRYAINKGGRQVPDGLLETRERINTIHDHNASLSINKDLNEDWNLDAVLGTNLRADIYNFTGTYSTQQFVFGLQDHGNYIEHSNDSYFEEESLLGAYLSATLGYRRFLYLNLQGRNDWTSTLEKDNRTLFYPSASLSFIPTEVFTDMTSGGVIDYLKIRVGYGTSAGYPNPYQTRNTLGLTTREFVTNSNAVINTNSVSDFFARADLAPELHREAEIGIEGRFFRNRFGIDLSLYQKKSEDLIIELDLDPSTGFDLSTVNAAKITNKGIELGMDVTPIKTRNLSVTLNGNFTTNENTVDEIFPGIDQIAIVGIFTTLGSYAIPGQPYGLIQGEKIKRDDNGNLLVLSSGLYDVSSDLQVLGDPNPDFNLNGGISINYKDIVTFNALLTYVEGGAIYSTLPSTLMGRGILQETDFDRFIPLIAPGVKADGTPNDVQITSTDHYWQNGGVFIDEMRTYDGSYLKLREISVSFALPKSVLDNTPFGSASLTFSGQNLWFRAYGFPKGANFDPEVLSTGVGNARGFEMMNVPTAKQVGGTLRLTF
ncbi:MAG: SusC/RagA family TonB-linked outer membrane protein [Saprospirales bacterium]|nr:SusC/RagA family TonB-linked outer membrane protein [Saprospirales bacterium]